MTTVAILPVVNPTGEKSYRAVAGDKQSMGKTAGQALDALATELNQPDFSGLLFISNFAPDAFFNQDQQDHLASLMSAWRQARDEGRELPPDQQAELDQLVEAELEAAALRTRLLIPHHLSVPHHRLL
jgi:hypothetical protein